MFSRKDHCGLCQELRDLKESHLLPSATYKLTRERHRHDPNPVVITKGRSFTTSRQVTAPFLCQECEDRFSRRGERYVLGQCARPDGDFKLRAALQKAVPVCVDTRFRIYDVQPFLGDRTEQYLYFAASVFWRAAARTWSLDGRVLERLSLGARYQEQFRLYLLERTSFPANGRLFVHAWSNNEIDLVTTLPSTTRVDRVKRHKFCVPGIAFILFLGGNVPKEHDAGALNSHQGKSIWLCRWENDSLFRGFLESIARSTPSGSLGRRARNAR